MKTIALSFIITVIISSILLSPQAKPTLSKVFSYSICDKPILYKVDTVDPQFNLSREEFLSDIAKAEAIWENPMGQELFAQDPQGTLSINLIFDERQSLTNQISDLEKQLQSRKGNLLPEIEEYKKMSSDFEQRLTALNSQIRFWNKLGGAPQEIYEKLTKEQEALKGEADRLNNMAQKLNLSAQSYNFNVETLNQTVKEFNSEISERPEEGIYKSEENRIEIYFNITRKELVHTLSHELGHARGLEHLANPKSIMYQNTTQITAAANDDISALKEICKRKNFWQIISEKFQLILNNYSFSRSSNNQKTKTILQN